jgi:maltose-binding protein MalE
MRKIIITFLAFLFLISCNKKLVPTIERTFETVIQHYDTTIKGAIVSAPIILTDSFYLAGEPVVIKDTSGNTILRYWRDQYGKLKASCETKDQTITGIKQTTQKTEKEIIQLPPKIVKETPFWNWLLIGALSVGVIYLIVRKAFFI